MKNLQANRGPITAVVIVLIIATLGYVFWRHTISSSVVQTQPDNTRVSEMPKTDPNEVRWLETENGGWKPSNSAPMCPEPLLTNSPVPIAQVREIAYPGQYRGTHYKAHGGLGMKTTYKNSVNVTLPMDMRLVSALRYLEKGEVQYLLTFENPCGIRVRYDHLLTLAPTFDEIAKTLPEPTSSTQSVPARDQPAYTKTIHKAGTLIATGVGMKSDRYGSGFDFGVYDLRQPNEISKNQKWAAIHKNESGHNFYGVCWLDTLPPADVLQIKKVLPLATDDRGASDYCSFAAGGHTLDYNNGQPVLTHSTPNISR